MEKNPVRSAYGELLDWLGKELAEVHKRAEIVKEYASDYTKGQEFGEVRTLQKVMAHIAKLRDQLKFTDEEYEYYQSCIRKMTR